jgi:hypothetical protein
MSTLIFDIETIAAIPEEQIEAIAKLAASREWTSDRYAALCPPLARVVCIGALEQPAGKLQIFADASLAPHELPPSLTIEVGDGSGRRLDADILPCRGEAELLAAFGRRLDDLIRNPGNRIATFSGRGFDLPVLLHRSIALGVKPGRQTVDRLIQENRFRPQQHIDLLETVTAFGASGRWPLAAYAIGYGYRSPKSEMDGSQVTEAVQSGRLADVMRYCAGDVLATAHVLAKVEA